MTMSKTKDGGPFFPKPATSNGSKITAATPGISLRDWFAGQALGSVPLRSWEGLGLNTGDEIIRAWAKTAYAVADAMLAAREAIASERSKPGASA